MAALALFFALVLASAAFIDWAIITFGFTMPLATWLMWSVGLSAIVALKLTGRDLSGLGWKWGSARHHLIAAALPVIYGCAAYFFANAAGLAEFPKLQALDEIGKQLGFAALDPAVSMVSTLFLMLTAGLVGNMASALGEEIGWRGFLTPRLTLLIGFFGATLVTGLIWSSWHLPILLFSGYNAGGEKIYEIMSFMVMITAISGAFAWLRLDSGSLWPAATLHASHNLVLQSILDPLTARGDGAITMTGEFGVVTAAACIVVCAPFWIAGMRAGRRSGGAGQGSA